MWFHKTLASVFQQHPPSPLSTVCRLILNELNQQQLHVCPCCHSSLVKVHGPAALCLFMCRQPWLKTTARIYLIIQGRSSLSTYPVTFSIILVVLWGIFVGIIGLR